MGTFGDKKNIKNIQKFECLKCNFICSKKGDWNRHLLRPKHKNLTFGDALVTEKTPNYICECGKEYQSRNGLWSHKKKCNNNNEQKELIKFLMKENYEFKQLMIEQNKTIAEMAKNSGINNNNFNLNFYLNETCKNAMNIMDFVNQLNVSINDLEDTGRLGYVNGISKIFINGLKQINVNERPIHCSDLKRETIYIKDNNEWNKDKTILTNAIKHVAHKNMKQIPEWIKYHPEYNDSDSKQNDRYLQIVSESMSGSSELETNKNYSKIIKNIVKETVIDK
jgi:hypothetical protein